ncbi:zinc finger protein [Trichonephila clavata]|uniref:Zinc finger protein n=1 Tax=Trichonephila clavata TaxID=2740835 RepID=A0A8X6HET8_TRICU|nr:zinc finger protein [Trichonephila clavata]
MSSYLALAAKPHKIAMSENGTYKRPIIINLFSSKTSSVPESEYQKTKSLCHERQFDQPNFVSTDYISDDLTEFTNSSKCKSTLNSDDSDKESSGIKRKFLKSWETLYPFIEYDREKNIMFCKVCKQFSNNKQKSIRFVSGTSNFRASSIQYHEKSVLHAKCQKRAIAMLNGNSNPVELLDSDRKKLIQVLKLVYFMIQTRSPFTYFPHLCETQKNEGVDVGPAYTSHQKVVPLFAKYISMDLEQKLTKELSGLSMFLLVIDNCFSRSTENHKLVYVKYLSNYRLKTVFLGVIDSVGNSVFENLGKLFERFLIRDWMEKIVCTAVHTIPESPWYDKLVEQIKEKSKNFICSLNFLLYKVKYCNQFFKDHSFSAQFFTLVYEIYWYYENLPDDYKHLPHISYELDNIIQGYGKLPKNTNLCFSFDALSAINQDWVPLVQFLKDQNDSILHTKTRKTGAKILLLVTRSQFLWKLALVMDILNCLSDFSNQAQDSNGLPFTFYNELQNACCDIQKAAEGKGATVQTFIQEMCTMPPSFRDTAIHIDINLNKVISGSQSLASLLVDFLNKQTFDKTFFDNYHIFDTRKWPQHEQGLTVFGNSEYLKLHLSLGKSEEQFALSEWQSFKKYVYQNFSSELLDKPKIVFLKVMNEFCSEFSVISNILIKLLFLDFSCKEVEKGYCEMNLIKSSDRCMLSVASLQHSMMVTMHGPLFAQFNPFPAIELWMKDCSRRYHKRSKQKNKNMILTDCDSFLESFNKSNNMNPF